MKPSHAATDNRLLELLHAAREGDTAARAELNDWLRADALARSRLARLLVDELAISNRLRDEQLIALLDEPALPFVVPSKKETANPFRARSWWTWAAAAVVALGLFGAVLPRLSVTPVVAATEPMPVAVLQDQAEASWGRDQLATGAALTPGTYALGEGLVALEFNNGARVLIEGPADFDILSENHMFFRSGRLSADVPPPAQGFTITTPTLRVVDLGTRFGLALSPAGNGVVRVEKGEIEVHQTRRQRNLREGQAIAFDGDAELDPSLFPDSLLPTEDDLRGRLAVADSRRQERWRAAFDRISRDPAAVLAYPFSPDTPTDRTIANRAAGASDASVMALVGAAWTEGRWPGKSAVEFHGTGDRLRLDAPGAYSQLTLLCWVRVDSLANEYNGLLIPNGYRPGSVQWMIRRDGRLRFSMVNGKGSPGTPAGWDRVIVAPAISPLDLGRWVFLATTYDSATGRVIHYRDGQPSGEGKLNTPLPAQLGSMGVGNWAGGSMPSPSDSSPKAKSYYRNLVGRIDELTVLSRALGPDEISAYYEEGRQ